MEYSVDDLVRARLRALRHHRGWSLEEVAERTGVGASTISRIETGHRSISLDVLVPLARELGVNVDELLASDTNDDVVLRPSAEAWADATVWPLSRPSSSTKAFKIRLGPSDRQPLAAAEPKIHPGHDWLFVLEGSIELTLGERLITVQAGESAEFSTMTPHAIAAVDAPAELIMLFDRHSARIHLDHSGHSDEE